MIQMTAKGDNSVKMHFRVIALSQSVSLITDVKFDTCIKNVSKI